MRNAQERKRRDEALLLRARKQPGGSDAREAVGELLLNYQGHVYQWCYRYIREHEGALDLAQEVMLEAYRALPGFDGRSSFSSWLFAITRNRCVSGLRRSSRTEVADVDLDLLPDLGDGPDRELERREQQEQILTAMRETLAEREQQALCLRIFDKLSVDAITEVLGLATATGARSVLQNARRKLRARLAALDPGRGENSNG